MQNVYILLSSVEISKLAQQLIMTVQTLPDAFIYLNGICDSIILISGPCTEADSRLVQTLQYYLKAKLSKYHNNKKNKV